MTPVEKLEAAIVLLSDKAAFTRANEGIDRASTKRALRVNIAQLWLFKQELDLLLPDASSPFYSDEVAIANRMVDRDILALAEALLYTGVDDA